MTRVGLPGYNGHNTNFAYHAAGSSTAVWLRQAPIGAPAKNSFLGRLGIAAMAFAAPRWKHPSAS